jgi:hypothetical protein
MLFALCAGGAWAQVQGPKSFGWVRANDEIVRLDPADMHRARVYRPGPQGGNMHVIIHTYKPVTVAMTWADAWQDAQRHPDAMANLEFRCLREHVVDMVYECHLPSDRPMVLLLRDERPPGRAVVLEAIAAAVGKPAARQFISPNDVRVTFHNWACVENCLEPEYQWIRVVKEKYELTSSPKLYSVLTPQYDGQRVWMKVKAKAPVTIAVLPSKAADEAYDKPESLAAALSQTTCKQRGVQTMEFECRINLADGPQSLIVLPESPLRSGKKAEIEFQAVKCTANCELIPTESGESQ